MQNANINLNQAECVIKKSNILTTEVVNVCNQTSTIIQNGTMDATAHVFLLTFVFLLMLFFLCGVAAMFYCIKESW